MTSSVLEHRVYQTVVLVPPVVHGHSKKKSNDKKYKNVLQLVQLHKHSIKLFFFQIHKIITGGTLNVLNHNGGTPAERFRDPRSSAHNPK
jgi:hypothetical protein